jgi:hypothetical protein
MITLYNTITAGSVGQNYLINLYTVVSMHVLFFTPNKC